MGETLLKWKKIFSGHVKFSTFLKSAYKYFNGILGCTLRTICKVGISCVNWIDGPNRLDASRRIASPRRADTAAK